MSFVNLTPHEISIITEGGTIKVPPSGQVARVATIRAVGPEVGGIPTTLTSFGEVEGLPLPVEGETFIVSALVQGHPSIRARPDVFSPGELVRSAEGQPIGCRGLTRAV